ncbi:GNAT family N-acetyltransferase [Hymenobacter sp. M29]|uniref:GNAT family N-acetyltransferase n=1 Tax=Hymenobacter mellowenesis TaxID=3063995 RepID=A0ABT9AJ67_9BACT|nr:GNAT family N-acetyltransferase [Hymenobacter sp. M29]MDO7849379.1 GNAT family N-acetyltransferase [Hymenobacter sp. M29]
MTVPLYLATATTADVPRLTRLVNRAYRGDASRQGWTTEAHLLDGQRIDEDGLREMLAVPGAAILMCLGANDELLGSFYAHATGEKVYLGMLAVEPGRQTNGVGKFLIHAAEDYGRQHGCTTSKMTVISVRAELLAYYARQGYRPTGATEPFPTDPRFGVPRQPLTLLVLEKSLVEAQAPPGPMAG